MNIFFPISAFYPSQIGGPCNTLYWHTSALSKSGFSISILTTSLGIRENMVLFDRRLLLDFVNVFYVKRQTLGIIMVLRIYNELAKSDIVHLNSLFSPFSIVTFLLARIFFPSIPVVWSVRGELEINALGFSAWKKKPVLILYKLLNERVVFHSTSDNESLRIREVFKNNNVIQIPNLIKPKERLIAEKSNYLLYLGRIHPIKALDKLVEAIYLSDLFLGRQFKLVIAGEHENRHHRYFSDLEMRIAELELQDCIVFVGHVEGIAKEKLLSEAYGLVLPSLSENFGNVVLEALNQGTPVIASKGTPWKILEDSAAGFYTENSPPLLANAIDSLLSLTSTDYEKMRICGYVLVDDVFNVENGIKDWVKIYNDLSNEYKK